ncbi:hypothetical protein MKP08_06380 [Erythrobacter sp. LQ02-29]|uniref:hypothetical protein n=1 Tax=Erythrobacter sp. LQ02-29 TaxID=2920384 RepID=UPI001F4E096D|nr:hypothetical protein [Erythrobacter sp. LQ02-29]MCP9222373.1 hypothetical protein [Erythrobacter sp. LQ02-29]
MNILIGLLTLGSATTVPVPPVAHAAVAMARCHPYKHKVHGCGRKSESADKERLAERDTTCRELPGKLRLCDTRPKSDKRTSQEQRAENESPAENDG